MTVKDLNSFIGLEYRHAQKADKVDVPLFMHNAYGATMFFAATHKQNTTEVVALWSIWKKRFEELAYS